MLLEWQCFYSAEQLTKSVSEYCLGYKPQQMNPSKESLLHDQLVFCILSSLKVPLLSHADYVPLRYNHHWLTCDKQHWQTAVSLRVMHPGYCLTTNNKIKCKKINNNIQYIMKQMSAALYGRCIAILFQLNKKYIPACLLFIGWLQCGVIVLFNHPCIKCSPNAKCYEVWFNVIEHK